MHIQSHGCRCPGDIRSQVISSHGVDQVLPEYSLSAPAGLIHYTRLLPGWHTINHHHPQAATLSLHNPLHALWRWIYVLLMLPKRVRIYLGDQENGRGGIISPLDWLYDVNYGPSATHTGPPSAQNQTTHTGTGPNHIQGLGPHQHTGSNNIQGLGPHQHRTKAWNTDWTKPHTEGLSPHQHRTKPQNTDLTKPHTGTGPPSAQNQTTKHWLDQTTYADFFIGPSSVLDQTTCRDWMSSVLYQTTGRDWVCSVLDKTTYTRTSLLGPHQYWT